MAPKNPPKPKRHKKRKSRTEVSSDSESEPEPKQLKKTSIDEEEREISEHSERKTGAQKEKSKHMTDAEVSAEFTKFYLERATKELEDDLDKLRTTTDFRVEHLGVLVDALKQGTSLFGMEEMRKIVLAGREE